MSNLPCEKKPSFRYPIGFWNYPSVQVTPVSQVESWKRAGITCNQTPFFSYGSHDPADMVAMLDEMHRAGMRAFVCVSDLDFHRFLQDPEAFRRYLRAPMPISGGIRRLTAFSSAMSR